MYYSLTFIPYKEEVEQSAQPPFSLTTDRNTWLHWRIAPASRPVFAPPSAKTSYTEVPGANGKIDLSQVLTGYPLYSNRVGTIEFVVLNDFRHWQTAYTDIMSTIHNKKLICVYEEDPEYFYVGRWTVNQWNSSDDRSYITLGYELDPFKWRIYDSNDAWLWNPFNFYTGVIADRNQNGFNSEVTVDIENYPFSDEPDAARKFLLNTNDSGFKGDETTDSIGTGYLDKMNNISQVIGTAPISPRFTVRARSGQVSPNILIKFTNPELPLHYRTKTITITHDITNEEFTDIILSNYTGINNVEVSVQGDGTVSWVYRPGRL